MTTQITRLAHNDSAFIYGVRRYPVAFIFGTIEAYAGQYGEDAVAEVAAALAKNQPLAWASPESTVISGDPGYYAAREAREATYPRLTLGDVVELEGRQYILRPDHNHNVRLEPVTEAAR